jgi:hypothetical protein
MPASELLRRVRARQEAYETFHPQWFWETTEVSDTGRHQYEVRSLYHVATVLSLMHPAMLGGRRNLGL